ncbi:MAG TPA: hypothetical protein P5307_19395, partial [Pirellulaceae bacterium]|nr:hypothetical protein [Pirellulaceae bacterium]
MQPNDTPSYVDVSLFDSSPADWDWAKIAKPAQSEEHVLSNFSSNILKILNVAPKRLPTKPQVNGAPILPKNPSSALLSTNTSPGTYVYVRDVDGLIHILPDGPGLHPSVLGNGQP